MILLRKGNRLSFPAGDLAKEALKSPPAVGGKNPPGDDQHDHRVPKRIFGSAPLLADAQDEEDNDKIKDIVKHAAGVLQGNLPLAPQRHEGRREKDFVGGI